MDMLTVIIEHLNGKRKIRCGPYVGDDHIEVVELEGSTISHLLSGGNFFLIVIFPNLSESQLV